VTAAESVFGAVFAGTGLLAILVGLYRSWHGLRVVLETKREETVSVREAARPTGVDEFQGVVEASDEYGTFGAPFSGQRAVLATYTVEARTSDESNSSRWRTEATDELTQPFLVRDDTGCVEVDPAGADIVPTNSKPRHRASESLPERVRLRLSVLTDRLDLQDILAQEHSRPRRYSEGYIAPGDTVRVHGTEVAERTHSSRSVDARVAAAGEKQLYRITARNGAKPTPSQLRAGLRNLIFGLIGIGVGMSIMPGGLL